MKVLLLGGNGFLGPHVVKQLQDTYELRITDIVPIDSPHETMQVDVSDLDQVRRATEGTDVTINCSVLRHDRKIAFDVSTTGTYNGIRAAVENGHARFVNTGPHFTQAGPSYEHYDFDINEEVPLHSGVGLYAHTKSLGQEICRVFAANHPIHVLTTLFLSFRDAEPSAEQLGSGTNPFSVTFPDAARALQKCLEVDLASLPSRCEIFHITTDTPHGRYSQRQGPTPAGLDAARPVRGLLAQAAGLAYAHGLRTGIRRPRPSAALRKPATTRFLAPGEVLVEIDLATICGSDLHTLSGLRTEPTPLILGHEAVGRIVASQRPGFSALGDRVSWSIADSCGTCLACTEHRLPEKCAALFKYGHATLTDGSGLNGCYATHLLIRPGHSHRQSRQTACPTPQLPRPTAPCPLRSTPSRCYPPLATRFWSRVPVCSASIRAPCSPSAASSKSTAPILTPTASRCPANSALYP